MPGRTSAGAPTPAPPPITARLVAAVIVGGMVGTVLRALLADQLVHSADTWPWATFAANLIGAALLGWIAPRTVDRADLHGLLGTGLCGGLTTFSTLQLEVLNMLDAGETGLAVAYVGASVVGGLALAAATAQLAARGAQPGDTPGGAGPSGAGATA